MNTALVPHSQNRWIQAGENADQDLGFDNYKANSPSLLRPRKRKFLKGKVSLYSYIREINTVREEHFNLEDGMVVRTAWFSEALAWG